ncbi:MAG: hypothetical protein PHF86_07925 [Candidatus Nanoarchaeia archaeon]|nr:hypothetical protein [Candidatus Nanoarchaeia archaeon]
MDNGTNNYGVFKRTPSEEIVSRTLQANFRNFSNVIWRTGKAALDSEWNLLNDVAGNTVSNLIKSNIPSGWLSLGKNQSSTNCGIANTIRFYAQEDNQEAVIPNAVVNGYPVLIGGVNYTDTILNQITLSPAGSAARWDFVFLEVWRAQLRARDENNLPIAQNKPDADNIYKFGNVQFGGTNLVDDSIDTVFDEETSERVQVQYRIRVVSNVDFMSTDSYGFDDTNVRAQGAAAVSQVASYNFTNMIHELGDVGLWRAGFGNEASQIALQTVDGYSYAIPMFKIYRRPTNLWGDTGGDDLTALYNQLGNSAVLSALVSDRPDGKFHDGIDATDIIDLRQKVSFSGWNYHKLLEQNLDKFFRGELRQNRIKELTYDAISDTHIFGYTDLYGNVGPSGKRIYWSDAITQQSDIFASVSVSTTGVELDVYRGSGTGNWAVGNTIVVHVTAKYPSGTIIKGTPRVYLEDHLKTVITGTWSNLNTNQAIFSMSTGIWVGTNYDIWVYYDTEIPAGQGITNVQDDLFRVLYANASSFPTSNGVVVRGQNIKTESTRFQDLFEHPFENITDAQTYTETESVRARKQVRISPLIQTTTSKNGSQRALEVETLNVTTKTIYVPYPLQHLRGVYTSSTGGTELAMQNIVSRIQVSDLEANKILVSADYFIGSLTSLQYIPAGPGSEIELLGYIYQGQPLSYVLEHRATTSGTIGSRISLYNSNGVQWEIPVGATVSQFKWAGTRTKVRLSAGAGYDIGGLIIDCTESTNTGYITTMSNRDRVWIDCDYLGAPHDGAQIKLIYSYSPYQGSSIGNQNLSLVCKREHGIFFNNGTGGGVIDTSGITGTSSLMFTPLSPKLPGSFNDYLRNGTVIEITGGGRKRFSTDTWMFASYDVYGYHGGGRLWVDTDYLVPATPETTQRGFLSQPMLEIIFEEPLVDTLYAEFAMPLLVRNKVSGELLIMIQIGNKGIHTSDSPILVDLFRLEERIITNNLC